MTLFTRLVILNPEYAAHVYNSLGELEKVDTEITKEDIKGLGDIIIKWVSFLSYYQKNSLCRYGYSTNVWVIKAHRHFDLASTEAMLEQPLGDDGSSGIAPVPLKKILKQKVSSVFVAARFNLFHQGCSKCDRTLALKRKETKTNTTLVSRQLRYFLDSIGV